MDTFNLDDYRSKLQQSLGLAPPAAMGGGGGAPEIGGDQGQEIGGGAGPQIGEPAPTAAPSANARGMGGSGPMIGGGGATGIDGMPGPSMIEQAGQNQNPLEGAGQPAAPPMQANMTKGTAIAPNAPGIGEDAGGKKKIDIGPPDFKPKYDDKKLAKAQTVTDVIAAMDQASVGKYMTWWEQTHGDINDKYNNMRQQLGQRPDKDRDPTKREKFEMLMDFGLSLLKNSGRGSDPSRATGAAIRETVDRQKGRQAEDVSEYDQQAATIEKNRGAELKDIGNYGNAAREQSAINRNLVDIASKMAPPKEGQPTTRYDKDGNMYEFKANGTNPITGDSGVWQPSVDANGKPLGKMMVTGPRGGVGKDGRTAQMKNVEYLKSLGVDDNTAAELIFKAKNNKTGDPRKDYKEIYTRTMAATFGDEDAAHRVASNLTEEMYGEGALQGVRDAPPKAPLIPNRGSTPPASSLKAGHVTTFKNGQKWTLDGSGQPKQVK